MPRLTLSNLTVWMPLIMFLVLVDQLMKAWVISDTSFQSFTEILPGLHLGHTHNTGIAFSMFAELGQHTAKVITLLALAVNLALIAVLCTQKRSSMSTLYQLALTLLISGGLSNLIDRLYYGAVIDFIYLNYHGWHWPTIFNLADVYICIGCLGLTLCSVKLKARDKMTSVSV